MEQQLGFGLQLVRNGVSVKYISEESSDMVTREDEIYIDKSKIYSCPDQHTFINSIQKKINRSDLFKSQKHTLGLCVLILLSKGYSVTSSVLSAIDDSFIERCWECIQNVSYNIPENICAWIQSSMETRSPQSYSVLYCEQKTRTGDIKYLNKKIVGSNSFEMINGDDFNIPKAVWHRDDAVYRTMISHMLLRDSKLSDDT